MKIEILNEANEDLIAGYRFYEKQSPGLGSYFLDTLFSAGIHRMVFGSYRSLSKRFPFAIYYRIEGETIRIRAVLDCRSNPASVRARL